MKPEEIAYNQQMQFGQAQQQSQEVQRVQQQMMLENQEKSMIKEQLDLTEELQLLEHLLRGEILEFQDDGSKVWVKPTDTEMIILSNYGIHLVMNTLQFYINKNTLLSFYDEETIYMKMRDFATALADVVFMEYEKIFQYPSFEDCKKVLDKRLENKKQLRKYAFELYGGKADDKQIEKDLLLELEGRIEKEIEKIKEQIIKNKLKRFEILIREIQDAVHSTYLRAFHGQERKTLRQHIHISETKGLNIQPESRGRGLTKWIKG